MMFRFWKSLHKKFGNGAGAEGIGINYALLGNNLPSQDKVVALLRSHKITMIHLLDPNHAVLATALDNFGIMVVHGTLNNNHSMIFATTCVRTNVMLYL